MKHSRIMYIVVFFLVMIQVVAFAKGPIQKGEPFPEIKLPVSEAQTYLAYLGIPNAGELFRIQDIKADVVIVQIFHSG